MRNRREEGFGSGFGMSGHDPHAHWEGPAATRGAGREPGRMRPYPDEEMMGEWGGPMGRGASSDPYGRFGRTREHGGFSHYDRERDDYRRFAPHREERDMGDHYGRDREWHGGSYGRGRFGMHDWGAPMIDRPMMMVMDRSGYRAEHAWDRHEPRWSRGGEMGMLDWEDDRGPFYARGPKGYKRSDDRIREDLCEIIFRQGYIDASDVEIIVETGVIRLVGTVPHRHDKRSLEQMAERIHGVDEVRNELRIRRDHRHDGGGFGRYEQHHQPHNGKNARS